MTEAKRRTAPGGERRQELLEIAASLFAERGYHGVGIRDIGARAGINSASLYYYFKSKEDALFEICLTGMQAETRLVGEMLERVTPMAERLQAVLDYLIADLERHSEFRIVFQEQRQFLSEARRAEVDKSARDFRRLLETMFEQAIETGELRPGLSARHAALTLAAAMRSLGQYRVAGLRDFKAFAAGFVETTIRGLSATAGERPD